MVDVLSFAGGFLVGCVAVFILIVTVGTALKVVDVITDRW